MLQWPRSPFSEEDPRPLCTPGIPMRGGLQHVMPACQPSSAVLHTQPGHWERCTSRSSSFPGYREKNDIQVLFGGFSPWHWRSCRGRCVVTHFPAFPPSCAEGRKLIQFPFHLQTCSFTLRQNINITFCLPY